jgi:serine/threonine protein kinase
VSDPSRVEEILLVALERGSPQERAAYLDSACQGDPDLRRRVERLLEAYPRAAGFLEPPAPPSGESTAAYIPAGEQVGTVLAGRYKLQEPIGEGGMGAVWMAQQTEPVRRLVAVKLIKPGMDSRAILARFEAERQALALMDHPNIAKVLDGGAAPDGRPFFVMELVRGIPITRYSDERHLTPRQRLELFIPICQAIQHAHQKGVIHRDLKPNNVLVAQYDGRPVPKVIDFGIAKAAGQPLTEQTLVTGFGTVVGTPEYMSPEQAELNQLDIDTRSDVYALGVLLYELLAGTTPFSRKELDKAGLLEILRVIREQEPPRPSARLSTADALPALAAKRGTEPRALTRLLRSELDWVVMKALEKDRNRRYETASGLAADVQRFLNGEPVSAVPPSASYRLRKFLRKHRRSVALVVIVFLALLAGAIGTSVGLVEARKQQSAALRAEADADQRRRQVERNAASLQLDLDLKEIEDDSRLGLLRLARTLKGLPDDLQELREFATMGVLAVGQRYVPLLPPITHDGHDVSYQQLSPDARTLLTLGVDQTARLWDTANAQQIAVLRRGNERVVVCALSPNGRTAVTYADDGISRFWEVPDGVFRAETERRPDLYSNEALSRSDNRLDQIIDDVLKPGLSNIRLLTRIYSPSEESSRSRHAPYELWDTNTGRLIARLDRPDVELDNFQFAAEGRWLAAVEDRSTVVVFSSEDGQEIARLPHPALGAEDLGPYILDPPTRRWVVTRVERRVAASDRWTSEFYAWDRSTWQRIPGVMSLPPSPGIADPHNVWVRDLNDDLILVVNHFNWFIGRPGGAGPLAGSSSSDTLTTLEASLPLGIMREGGPLLLIPNGMVFDMRTGQRLLPPSGRRFHPDLSRFAPDGRFFAWFEGDQVRVVDVLADKMLSTLGHSDDGEWWAPFAHRPGFGMVGIVWSLQSVWLWHSSRLSHAARILLVPAVPPDIPADLLELWSQVAVRGEIGPDGNFTKWNEPTWERKRQELAAYPPPSTAFPFPGHVVADRMHWLRSEFEDGETNGDNLPLVKQLLDRAETAGDRAEAVRWRNWLEAARRNTGE